MQPPPARVDRAPPRYRRRRRVPGARDLHRAGARRRRDDRPDRVRGASGARDAGGVRGRPGGDPVLPAPIRCHDRRRADHDGRAEYCPWVSFAVRRPRRAGQSRDWGSRQSRVVVRPSMFKAVPQKGGPERAPHGRRTKGTVNPPARSSPEWSVQPGPPRGGPTRRRGRAVAGRAALIGVAPLSATVAIGSAAARDDARPRTDTSSARGTRGTVRDLRHDRRRADGKPVSCRCNRGRCEVAEDGDDERASMRSESLRLSRRHDEVARTCSRIVRTVGCRAEKKRAMTR
jgi:hypothetical protein